ncbi:MAG: DUF4139 domain-containing protein [Labilithrix sp.]|nr:DUF4139 domain-containing protein [Labilithrix sp.]
MSHRLRSLVSLVAIGLLTGCGRQAVVSADGLPLKRVVVYRNGVAYFERSGHVEESEVRFKMKESAVGDFLATLAVSERGGSSVRSAAFPLKVDDGKGEKDKKEKSFDEKRGLKNVVLSLDGRAHDLEIGYVAESPVWKPSYRLVVEKNGEAYLQAWGIVQNLSGEDWHDVKLSLVAGAPLAFEAQLGHAVIPERPVVTDRGEVIAAVPRGDTSLAQADRDGDGIPDDVDKCPDEPETFNGQDDDDGCPDRGRVVIESEVVDAPAAKAEARKDRAPSTSPSSGAARAPEPSRPMAPPPPPPPPPKTQVPRSLRSLAAVAVEAGTTRYDLPQPVTIPDKSATMVMLLSRRVPGEALFLFAPDSGVADSSTHPFRVARFVNKTQGVLERGPIAVFESGSFLGQGMVDPLPAGATATVPFALERALAVDQDQRNDELGERVAKIENGELTIERDTVRVVKYRIRNGADLDAKILVRHPRIAGARLHQPPPETEDNVGTQSALVPGKVKGRSTIELIVDERTSFKRREDWFSIVADNAVKAYLADPRADKAVAQRLGGAWVTRKEIVDRYEARAKLAQEQSTLQQQTQEIRANLRAIEKNRAADQLRAKLTARLTETSTKLDDISKRIVEIDAKLAELRIQFKELLRDVKLTEPLALVK